MAARHRSTRLAAAALGLLALMGAGGAGGAGGTGASSAAQDAPRSADETVQAALERWRSLSDGERDVLRERFARLRAMSPEERARLEERAGTLAELRRLERERMSDELQRKLEALPPEQRREVMREHMLAELRRRGERILDKLPPPMRAQLESAPPEERERVLHELLRGMRGGPDERGLERLCDDLELPPEAVERLRGLPPEARMHEVLRLRKEAMLERAARRGRPPRGLSAEEWEAIAPLPPPHFFEELGRRGHGFGEEPGPGSHGEALRELGEALRPTLDDLVEAAELAGPDRMRWIGARARERALGVLARRGLLPPEELARLAELEGFDFVRAVHERFGLRHAPPRLGRPDERGGERGGFLRGGRR